MPGSLHGKRIVLGVSGGIAAYKAVEVCRKLVDAGAHVIPVMTENARRFIGEVTLSALASERVQSSMWNEDDPIPHTKLGQGADLILVVPATARFIATYAAGITDGLLLSTVLATRAPVVICPAMHTEMWEHAAVQDNLATLRRRGVHVVEPESGRLAGGDLGTGRLADPAAIVDAATSVVINGGGELSGVRVLISAGGTREPIDPVRFITNRSSGKQGYALAFEAADRGAEVTIVSTVDHPVPTGIEVVRVETAAQMFDEMTGRAPQFQIVIMAAAVADFRPKVIETTKLHKADGIPDIVLEPTPDILLELGKRRVQGQVIVGFAAETDSMLERAVGKLKAKQVDFMVGNDVSAAGVGFDHETNAVTILGDDGSVTDVPLRGKREVAKAVFDSVTARLA